MDEFDVDDPASDVPLLAIRGRWKTKGSAVLDGFQEGLLRLFKRWVTKNGKEKELGRWSWTSKSGVVRPLSELEDEM